MTFATINLDKHPAAQIALERLAARLKTATPEFVAGVVPFLETLASGEMRGSATYDLVAHLRRQREWSERTFGPGSRAKGVIAHIRKELVEIETNPTDLTEWIDVATLALDGAWRSGATPEQIIAAWVAKADKNENRVWPDWRTMSEDQAIEHERALDPRDPDPTREGIFRDHNCARCNSGAKPCVQGQPNRCEFPHARND